MANRLVQLKSPNPFFERIWNLLRSCFDSNTALEKFVGEKIGKDFVDGVNWDQPMKNSAFDLLCNAIREGWFDSLVSSLQEERPDDAELTAAVSAMLAAGVLAVQN